jgi:hypothetical protein
MTIGEFRKLIEHIPDNAEMACSMTADSDLIEDYEMELELKSISLQFAVLGIDIPPEVIFNIKLSET